MQAWLYHETQGLPGLGWHLKILRTIFSSPLQKKGAIIGRRCILDYANNLIKFIWIVHT
jgi:hypothetical protein